MRVTADGTDADRIAVSTPIGLGDGIAGIATGTGTGIPGVAVDDIATETSIEIVIGGGGGKTRAQFKNIERRHKVVNETLCVFVFVVGAVDTT